MKLATTLNVLVTALSVLVWVASGASHPQSVAGQSCACSLPYGSVNDPVVMALRVFEQCPEVDNAVDVILSVLNKVSGRNQDLWVAEVAFEQMMNLYGLDLSTLKCKEIFQRIVKTVLGRGLRPKLQPALRYDRGEYGRNKADAEDTWTEFWSSIEFDDIAKSLNVDLSSQRKRLAKSKSRRLANLGYQLMRNLLEDATGLKVSVQYSTIALESAYDVLELPDGSAMDLDGVLSKILRILESDNQSADGLPQDERLRTVMRVLLKTKNPQPRGETSELKSLWDRVWSRKEFAEFHKKREKGRAIPAQSGSAVRPAQMSAQVGGFVSRSESDQTTLGAAEDAHGFARDWTPDDYVTDNEYMAIFWQAEYFFQQQEGGQGLAPPLSESPPRSSLRSADSDGAVTALEEYFSGHEVSAEQAATSREPEATSLSETGTHTPQLPENTGSAFRTLYAVTMVRAIAKRFSLDLSTRHGREQYWRIASIIQSPALTAELVTVTRASATVNWTVDETWTTSDDNWNSWFSRPEVSHLLKKHNVDRQFLPLQMMGQLDHDQAVYPQSNLSTKRVLHMQDLLSRLKRPHDSDAVSDSAVVVDIIASMLGSTKIDLRTENGRYAYWQVVLLLTSDEVRPRMAEMMFANTILSAQNGLWVAFFDELQVGTSARKMLLKELVRLSGPITYTAEASGGPVRSQVQDQTALTHISQTALTHIGSRIISADTAEMAEIALTALEKSTELDGKTWNGFFLVLRMLRLLQERAAQSPQEPWIAAARAARALPMKLQVDAWRDISWSVAITRALHDIEMEDLRAAIMRVRSLDDGAAALPVNENELRGAFQELVASFKLKHAYRRAAVRDTIALVVWLVSHDQNLWPQIRAMARVNALTEPDFCRGWKGIFMNSAFDQIAVKAGIDQAVRLAAMAQVLAVPSGSFITKVDSSVLERLINACAADLRTASGQFAHSSTGGGTPAVAGSEAKLVLTSMLSMLIRPDSAISDPNVQAISDANVQAISVYARVSKSFRSANTVQGRSVACDVDWMARNAIFPSMENHVAWIRALPPTMWALEWNTFFSMYAFSDDNESGSGGTMVPGNRPANKANGANRPPSNVVNGQAGRNTGLAASVVGKNGQARNERPVAARFAPRRDLGLEEARRVLKEPTPDSTRGTRYGDQRDCAPSLVDHELDELDCERGEERRRGQETRRGDETRRCQETGRDRVTHDSRKQEHVSRTASTGAERRNRVETRQREASEASEALHARPRMEHGKEQKARVKSDEEWLNEMFGPVPELEERSESP